MARSVKKVVLTGGHAATTALAVVEEIIRRKGDSWEIYWIGVRRAFVAKSIPTLESSALPAHGVVFRSIFAGRLQRRFTKWTIPSMLKIPVGILHALYLLLTIRPKVVLSFGSFAAYPVVVASWLLRIPVIVHEQTSVVGRANEYSAFFAKKIAISRDSSRRFFPKEKVVLTGNPLMTQIWEIPIKKTLSSTPTIFVTGGSRGSLTLNNLVVEVLKDLLKKYIVIHQTGHLDFEKIKKVRSSLPKDLRARYEVYPVIDPMQMDGVYKRADIIIARAGANTVAEIMAVKRPAILIPIPWTAHDEQTKNASAAKEFGIAEILEEKEATGQALLLEIEKITRDYENIVLGVASKKSPDKSASQKLVDLLDKYIK